MKKVKFLLLTIILIVSFVCEAEIFQIELWNFDEAYFRNAAFKTSSEEERVELFKDIEELAKEYQAGILCSEMRFVDMHNNELHIFCNETAKDEIIKKTNIKQERYESLITGNTEVFYHDFTEMQQYENRYVNSISFTGKDTTKIYNLLQRKYEITYPEIMGGTERDIIFAVWSLVAILMIVLTVMQVFFYKKEVVVRVSFGESVWNIIGKNVLFEVILSMSIFFIVKFCVFQFVSGQFMEKEILGIYALGVAISCLMYLFYAFYDIKAAFANATNTSAMLGILYITKIVVSIATIIGIGFNFSVVIENSTLLNKERIMEIYQGYDYFFLTDNVRVASRLASDEDIDEEMYRGEETIPQIAMDIYRKYYDIANPLVCMNLFEDTISYLLINDKASAIVEDFIEIEDFSEDILVLMPEGENEELMKGLVDDQLHHVLKEYDPTLKYVKYDGYRKLTYINQSASTGIITAANPVVIYVQSKELSQNLYLNYYVHDILYQLDEKKIEQIKTDYMIEENGYSLKISDFMDNYEYYQGFIKKLVGFVSSVSVFLLLLLLVLIVIINTLEYQVNAMKLAVKKVVGYSVFEKNKRTLLLCVGIDLIIAAAATCLMVVIGKRTAIISTAEVALIVTGLELFVCLLNIYRIEKKGIVKILKGGCL